MSIEVSVIAVIAFVFIGTLLSGIILYTRRRLVSTAPCKIEINKDPSLTKEVEGGKTLLSALLEQGIAIPSPCGGKATCKQCRVQVVKGGDDSLETDKATFTPKQLTEGWRLSCQCKVKHDLGLKLPDTLLTLKEIRGTVVSNRNVATFIKELVIEVPESERVDYIPGDYLQFHVPNYRTNTEEWRKTMDEEYYEDWEHFDLFGHPVEYEEGEEEVIRAYSMASYPEEGNLFKFNIRIATPPFIRGKIAPDIPWGICSSYIFGLQEGEGVRLSGPYGESHMVEDDREIVFLIGGAGSSFGRSHIMDLFKTRKTQRKITLWYGARSLKENIYQDDYEGLDQAFANFSYHLVLSEPTDKDLKEGWPKEDPLKTNYLFKAFEAGQLKEMEEPENALYFVCGPPLHNSSVLKLLDDYGVPEENVILDDFGS
ncbi:NADH:ubiquinone reductase (Na(+)-transporting) subunit F [Candidatus Neptunichlamydia sp. REUL1]|uniref:NADH:ubiquinone reductase (Na(+)-transporting) subunit F n=1 Tax=Candidatus Neptunichlamydia sp. REUL1 TaxID=3064277 RepID=UPI00292F60A4|nr:NADH:ubiquinone reductase (Na(+)-transporting) subunit F [Candidatus Neptunochlamydia sp. REUL1]